MSIVDQNRDAAVQLALLNILTVAEFPVVSVSGTSADGFTLRLADGTSQADIDRANAALPAATLAAKKAVKIAAIDAKSGELIVRGFVYDGHTFSLSTNAQLNWTALFAGQSLIANWPVTVSSLDSLNESYLIPNPTTLGQFCGTAIGTVRAILDAGNKLKADVVAAPDVASIDAVIDAR